MIYTRPAVGRVFIPLFFEGIQMSSEVVQKTKAEVVRQILTQIGATKQNPPEGWFKKTTELLAKANIKVHQTHVYAIRNKMLRKNRIVNKKPTEPETRPAPTKSAQICLSDLLAVKNFSKQFGGLEKLRDCIRALEQFVN